MEELKFNPEEGYANSEEFPNPSSGTQTREQLMEMPNQIKTFINTVVVAGINDIVQALNNKQDRLTIDSAPTAGSTNPVQSGGVKTAMDALHTSFATDSLTIKGDNGSMYKIGVDSSGNITATLVS